MQMYVYSIHVVLRNETVDRAKPGDKVVFTGTLVVVPDVRQMSKSMHHLTFRSVHWVGGYAWLFKITSRGIIATANANLANCVHQMAAVVGRTTATVWRVSRVLRSSACAT